MAANQDVRKFLLRLLVFSLVFFLLDRGIAALLRRGLDRNFGLDKRASVLCIGHSHTMLGIDGEMLEQGLEVPVAKYALNGADAFDRLAMIRHFIGSHPESVRLVVYDVDDHTFTGAGLSSNSYRLFFPYLDNPDIDRYIRQKVGSSDEYMSRRLVKLLSYNSRTLNMAVRGILRRYDNIKTGQVDIAVLKKEISTGRRQPITIDKELKDVFAETVRFVRNNNAQLVLLYIPTLDLVNDIDKDQHKQVIDIFRNYAAQDKGVIFLNYNPDFSHRHELFFDPVHLNNKGMQAVTTKAMIDLKLILNTISPEGSIQ
jgi:hypothetical protein